MLSFDIMLTVFVHSVPRRVCVCVREEAHMLSFDIRLTVFVHSVPRRVFVF